MSPGGTGPLAQLWYRWKALRLPWRKRFYVGHDLNGYTYWEFRLTTRGDSAAPTAERWRRIVEYPRSTPYSDVVVSPLWHQWLRHTRSAPPSLAEQRNDVVRLQQTKLLAAQADARWEAKPRLVQGPASKDTPRPATRLKHKTDDSNRSSAGAGAGAGNNIKDDDAWKKATLRAKAPGEDWQPAQWNPPAAKKP